MNQPLNTQRWYDDDGLTLTVTCDERNCLAEIVAPQADGSELDFEILRCSRDSRGMPSGPSFTVYQRSIRLQALSDGAHAFARFWLPAAMARRLRDHFFRIRAAG